MAYIDLSGPAMQQLKEALKPYAEFVARDLRNEIVQTMDPGTPRTGRMYPVPGTKSNRDRSPRSGPRPMYQASAPGEAPAVATASYVNSWQVSPAIVHGDTVAAFTTNSRKTEDGEHFVGEVLEYGTQDGRIAPRPHIRPALEAVAKRHGGVVVEPSE